MLIGDLHHPVWEWPEPGDLTFRVTPGDGSDPIEITVPVIMGARQETIARGIRNTVGLRLNGSRGVRLDGEPLTELDVPRERLSGRLLQAGKRRFARLTA